MEEISELRDEWYEAWFDGDVDKLEAIELPEFMIISEAGMQTARDRYAPIKTRIAQGQWFGENVTKKDVSVSYRHFSEFCEIVGIAQTCDGDQVLAEWVFSELWILRDDQWFVKSQHITQRGETPRPLYPA